MLILEIAGGVALGLLLLGVLSAALSYKSPSRRAYEERQVERLVHQVGRSQYPDILGAEFGPDVSPVDKVTYFINALNSR